MSFCVGVIWVDVDGARGVIEGGRFDGSSASARRRRRCCRGQPAQISDMRERERERERERGEVGEKRGVKGEKKLEKL